jgi:MFS family permease
VKKFTQSPAYRWVIVGCCFVIIFACLGFCSSTKGLYLEPVTKALQLERSLYSVNDTLRYIASAIINLLFGMLVLRFGPRKLVAGGFACLCGAMLCYTFAQNLVLIYLGGILLGVGQSWSSTTLVGFVIGRWCPQNKGTIMGAVLAANGVGSAAAAQIVGPMINGSLFGYRNAYGFTALLMIAVGIVVVTLFRDQPAQTVVAAAPQKKRRGVLWDGIDLKRALKTPYFYIVCFYVFVMGLVIQSLSAIFPAHMKDVGLDPAYVTTVVSIYAVILAGTKFFTGFAYDRLGLPVTLTLCNVATVIAPVLLALLGADSQRLAMVYGIVYAIGVPIQTIGMPLLTADLFGQRDEASILGVLVAVSTVGYAVGTPMANLFYDSQGTYSTALTIMAVSMAVASVAIVFALGQAKKLRTQNTEIIGG